MIVEYIHFIYWLGTERKFTAVIFKIWEAKIGKRLAIKFPLVWFTFVFFGLINVHTPTFDHTTKFSCTAIRNRIIFSQIYWTGRFCIGTCKQNTKRLKTKISIQSCCKHLNKTRKVLCFVFDPNINSKIVRRNKKRQQAAGDKISPTISNSKLPGIWWDSNVWNILLQRFQ